MVCRGVNMHVSTHFRFAFGPHDHKSLISCLRSQTCTSSVRRRSSSEPGRWRIWRSSGQTSSVQPASRFRRQFEVGCRELDTERSARLLLLCKDTGEVTWRAGECLWQNSQHSCFGCSHFLLSISKLIFKIPKIDLFSKKPNSIH